MALFGEGGYAFDKPVPVDGCDDVELCASHAWDFLPKQAGGRRRVGGMFGGRVNHDSENRVWAA